MKPSAGMLVPAEVAGDELVERAGDDGLVVARDVGVGLDARRRGRRASRSGRSASVTRWMPGGRRRSRAARGPRRSSWTIFIRSMTSNPRCSRNARPSALALRHVGLEPGLARPRATAEQAAHSAVPEAASAGVGQDVDAEPVGARTTARTCRSGRPRRRPTVRPSRVPRNRAPPGYSLVRPARSLERGRRLRA